jgi:hypothetical protein
MRFIKIKHKKFIAVLQQALLGRRDRPVIRGPAPGTEGPFGPIPAEF